MEQYTGFFHLGLMLIGILIYQGHKVYSEKALVRSVYLCIEKGEVHEMGSTFGYNEYRVKRGSFYFFIQEFKTNNFITVKIYQNDDLVYEKCSLDILGIDCREITQKLNDKLKVA